MSSFVGNAYAQALEYRSMRVTKDGARNLLRELSRHLSDEAIAKMLEGLPVIVYEDGEGAWAEIPAALAARPYERQMPLFGEDVVPDDDDGGFE